MKTKAGYILFVSFSLILAGVLWIVTNRLSPVSAFALLRPDQDGAPSMVSYQGEVRISGSPYTGDGFFKFAVINTAGDTTYWSNDGSSTGGGEPTAVVELSVSKGLFSVLLGDTSLGGMTQALTADVFDQTESYLRVWFSKNGSGPFNQLTPDTRIAAVPYALQAQEAANADTLDGLHASQLGLGSNYQNVVTVAKSGGDYTSVQAAIDSISDASASNPYLVWVAPGIYEEQVTMKPHVHLQGAGQEVTLITSTASSSVYPPDQATLLLASDASLRDLTVGNMGDGSRNAAILATGNLTRTLVADVTAQAQGDNASNYAVFLSGSSTDVRLKQVTGLAENAVTDNIGLVIDNGTAAVLRDCYFTGRGGQDAIGIANFSGTLQAEGTSTLAENGHGDNYSLLNNGGEAKLHGGSFTGRGGVYAFGIWNYDSGTTLEAEGVTALGENGSLENYGLGNAISATVTLRGGAFTGRGGEYSYGISNDASGATLTAESVTALGEDGYYYNYGLSNQNGATVLLQGGSFTAYGGYERYSIYNSDNGSNLTADNVSAFASLGRALFNSNGASAILNGGSYTGYTGMINRDSGTTLEASSVSALGYYEGLWNTSGAGAVLHGGSFTGSGSGPGDRYGILNQGSLEANCVIALAESSDGSNGQMFGLFNNAGATAVLHGGTFIGYGGLITNGIRNHNSTLEANNITAMGHSVGSNYGLYNYDAGDVNAANSKFTGSNDGLYLDSGIIHLGLSQLNGGATNAGGTLTCFQVYDETYTTYTCP